MDLGLAGKVAIVSGASRGIGRAVAETLSAEGMKLVLAARSQAKLEALAGYLPGESLVLSIDLREPGAGKQVVSKTIGRFEKLDLLINNAGATKRGDFLALTDEEWQDGFALKFYAAMRLSRAAWPHLQASAGTIVNIIGVGGRTGSAEFTIGGAVNAALLNLTKALADRGIRDGVRVNAINPGSIATERLQTRIQAYAKEKDISVEEAAKQLPHEMKIARFGDPFEIARTVAFLASPRPLTFRGLFWMWMGERPGHCNPPKGNIIGQAVPLSEVEMQCPVCKEYKLGPIKLLEGLPATQCPNCNGVFLPSNAFMTWRRTLGSGLPEKEGVIEIDPSWDVKELKLCPDCGHIMARYKIIPDTDFYLDRCRNCNGIWLEYQEWEVLADRNLHDNLNEFFTRPWQDNLHAAETRNHLDAIYLEKLGEQDYKRIKEIREWLRNHPRHGMLLAFLQAEDPYKV